MSIVELKSLAVVRLRVVVVREVSDLESIASVAAGRGAKGGMCPRWHCAGGGIWSSENMVL